MTSLDLLSESGYHGASFDAMFCSNMGNEIFDAEHINVHAGRRFSTLVYTLCVRLETVT